MDERLRRRRSRARFDRAAGGYEAAARLDAEVGVRMFERLDYMRIAPQRILDAGAGTGRDARALARRYAGATVLALDHSQGMLQQLRAARGIVARLLGRAPLAMCAEIERLPLANATADLVWSNLALHCMDDPLVGLRELARVLRPQGLLMFSAYGPDSMLELALASKQAFGASRVRRFADMHDLGDMLVAAGLANPVMDMEHITLTYADAKGFYADLRATAQAHARTQADVRGRGEHSGHSALGGRRRIAALSAALDAQRREGRLSITYEIVYGHAWKVAPSRTAEGHAVMRTTFPALPGRAARRGQTARE